MAGYCLRLGDLTKDEKQKVLNLMNGDVFDRLMNIIEGQPTLGPHTNAAECRGMGFTVGLSVHYMIESEPDDTWRLACLCDEPLPDVVTVKAANVTCPKCLEILRAHTV